MSFLKINKNCWWNIKYVILGTIAGIMVGLFVIPETFFSNILLMAGTSVALLTKEKVFIKESLHCKELFEFSKCDKSYLMYIGYMQALQCVAGINCITIFLLQ